MTKNDHSRGYVLGVSLHVLLILVILGEVVFLASRYRLRMDVTSDQLYTLTGSTRRVLDSLDQRLLIEAYFSPKDDLAANWRDFRTVLDNFLDELVQMGDGKVVLQRFDPLEDQDIQEKCTRLGIQPVDLQSGTTSSLSVNRVYQGLRFLYGGEKKKVIPVIRPTHTALLEAQITPAIKEVISGDADKSMAYMEWPVDPMGGMGQQARPQGWHFLRTTPEVAKRFEIKDVKNTAGALIPEDYETLFLFRPKDLTDRTKYVIDQFLMRGGTLVVFADAAHYVIGQNRSFHRQPLQHDAPDSEVKFLEQMEHYGVRIRDKIVADMAPQAHRSPTHPLEYLAIQQRNALGMTGLAPVPYPYFFHPLPVDWSTAAERLATDPSTGNVDEALAEQYRQRFQPGLAEEVPALQSFAKMGRGPGLYWPCAIDLPERMPDGVEGRVLMRSSPLALVEDPPQNLNPIGGYDAATRNRQFNEFWSKLQRRLDTDPRRQVDLMIEVEGSFRSFFEGRDIPKKPADETEEEENPLEAPVEESPDEGVEATEEQKAEDEQAAEVQGPPAPDAAQEPEADKDAEPAPVFEATAPGRIIVVADSDFLRDDLVRGEYQNAGGPASLAGGTFWLGLLEWLAEDQDLLELRNKASVDRSLVFAQMDVTGGEDLKSFESRRKSAERTIRWLNLAVPIALLALIGIAVGLVQRNKKQTFLSEVGA